MFENDTFEKPAAQQTTSQLLLLPAEIVIKILRMLMKETEALTPFRRGLEEDEQYRWKPAAQVIDQRRTSYVKKLQLSAQLLRSCQVLHHEGMTHPLQREHNRDSLHDRA